MILDIQILYKAYILLLEVNQRMSDDFEVIYAKEGKELTTLVQEWINENIENITSKCRQIELQRRKN